MITEYMSREQIIQEFSRDEDYLQNKAQYSANKIPKHGCISYHQHTRNGNDYIVKAAIVKEGRERRLVVESIAKVTTNAGVMYISRASRDHIVKIYAHAISRFIERAGVSQDAALVAFSTSLRLFNIPAREVSREVVMALPYGLALGAWSDEDDKIIIIKTFVANEMLRQEQVDLRRDVIARTFAGINIPVPPHINDQQLEEAFEFILFSNELFLAFNINGAKSQRVAIPKR